MREPYTLGSSSIPPKDKLIKEYKYHDYWFDVLTSDAHLDEYITSENTDKLAWHRDEFIKIEKVLHALYPGYLSKLEIER